MLDESPSLSVIDVGVRGDGFLKVFEGLEEFLDEDWGVFFGVLEVGECSFEVCCGLRGVQGECVGVEVDFLEAL